VCCCISARQSYKKSQDDVGDMTYKYAILLAALAGAASFSASGQSTAPEIPTVPLTQQAEPKDAAPLYAIERTFVTTIAAPDGHPYRILVSWPQGSPPETGWPVLYLLDGADNFAVATVTTRRLERAGARSGGGGGGIIVGIDSGSLTRRVLDYTPPSPGYLIPEGAPASGLPTGGSEQFLSFIETHVKPFVKSRWDIDPHKETLAGHSFGGLLALHALFTQPDIAQRYAAISPSLWFGDGLMNREEDVAQIKGATAVLVAEADGEGQADTARALADRMAAKSNDVHYLSLSHQTHGTTMLASIAHIITLAFGADK